MKVEGNIIGVRLSIRCRWKRVGKTEMGGMDGLCRNPKPTIVGQPLAEFHDDNEWCFGVHWVLTEWQRLVKVWGSMHF